MICKLAVIGHLHNLAEIFEPSVYCQWGIKHMNQVISAAPIAGNNDSALAVPKTCPSKKKVFVSESEAAEWEASNRKKHNLAQQHPYKCEDCPHYHLTAMTPDAFAMANSRRSLPQPVENKSKKAAKGERQAQVTRLVAQGITDAKTIATKLDISVANAYIVLSKVRKQQQERLKAAPVTIDDIDAQEKALQAQLQKLAGEKQRLIDLKALKVKRCWNGEGVLIQKENEHMALRLADVAELAEKLMDFLPQNGDQQ